MTKATLFFILLVTMSIAEESIRGRVAAVEPKKNILIRFLDLISSVRFGVTLLVILVILSMIGMLIIQQNVQGFDSYYLSLTPAERYLFGALGFFDIYHSWYYLLILLVLSLNIILASIDRFPSAWDYITNPKKTATLDWLRGRQITKEFVLEPGDSSEIVGIVEETLMKNGYKKPQISVAETKEYAVNEDGTKDFSQMTTRKLRTVFGEWGKINRLGAYIIHVFLLTLFLGHFVSLMTGFDADVRMVPGVKTDEIEMIEFRLDEKNRFKVQIPFSIECTDIQQTLINEKGGIDVTNTLDWRTQMRIDDPEYGSFLADVSMNKPVQYRGYRFFQAQTIPMGNARVISLDITPQAGGDPQRVEIPRNESVTLPDGTLVEYAEFMPDFTFGPDGRPDTRSGDYNNPAAVLNVTPPNSERIRVFAFAQKFDANIPIAAPKAGYKWHLSQFEKSPYAHVLSIKYDPFNAAFIAWYVGGFGLMGALMFVFFFSHQRIWADIRENEKGETVVFLAGDANRNAMGFSDRFYKVAEEIESQIGNKE